MRENDEMNLIIDEELFSEFGELTEKIKKNLTAATPESLSADELFSRFEGLMDIVKPDGEENSSTKELKSAASGYFPGEALAGLNGMIDVVTTDMKNAASAAGEISYYEIPDSQDEAVATDTVKPAGQNDIKPQKSRGFKFYMPRIIAAAACIAIAVVGIRQVNSNRIAMVDDEPSSSISTASSPVSINPSLRQMKVNVWDGAENYSEIRSQLIELQNEANSNYGSETYTVVDEASLAPVSPSTPAMGDGAKLNPSTSGGNPGVNIGGGGYYQTNVQEKGIDEDDIIKTDGTYLYVHRFSEKTGNYEIAIIRAKDLKPMSRIELDDSSWDGTLYVEGDNLILLRTLGNNNEISLSDNARQPIEKLAPSVDSKNSPASSSEAVSPNRNVIAPVMPGFSESDYLNVVEVSVYNIKDKTSPQKVTSYTQDGSYLASRYKDGIVYTVTNKYVYNSVANNSSMPMSMVFPLTGKDGKMDILPADRIAVSPYISSPRFITITATDIKNNKRSEQAVFGAADTVYMSQDAIYLTSDQYDYSTQPIDERVSVVYNSTGIIKLGVDGVDLSVDASASVEGSVDGQFAFSEKDGYLRVATTSFHRNGSTNALFVLDSGLNTVGAVGNLAPGETIRSVRYVGNMGYIVTFKEIDPLFAIDLTDPQKPIVVGELKVPGFSEYIHPIDDKTLLGFGYNTKQSEWGGTMTDGLKLSLFDVSDPKNPVEKMSYPIGNSGSYSEAIDNHKAFMYYPEKKLVGIPVSVETSTATGMSNQSFSGFLLFEMGKDGFKLYGEIPSRESSSVGFGRYEGMFAITRGVYIGDTLYTISDGVIMSHKLRSGTPKSGEYLFDAAQ